MLLAPSAGKRVRPSHSWFCFVSHWLKKWSEFFLPITERDKEKPKLTRISFDTPLKTAL